MILKLFKIGSKPATIAYPLPLVSFLGFCLSGDLISFVASYLFALFFFTAINLWNHVNDAEDDFRAGRAEAEFLIYKRTEATAFVISCYVVSSLLVFWGSKDKEIALLTFLISALLTWIYSDKIFIGRILRRLKEDYRTEILTYLITTMSFFLLFWTFFSKVSMIGISFALVLSAIYLSGFFLKDIKDISADIEAGYRTLAVVFPPGTLLKFSVFSFVVAIILAAISPLLTFPSNLVFLFIMLIPLLYCITGFCKHHWKIDKNIISELKIYTKLHLLSILSIAVLSCFRNLSIL
ncbi:MAG: UbiA family prenyltransferase [Archaeoglobus sp.]|uniref:UbiA family prenyltransferase n=1 Tax=Archaeoglobus sp. TaxID=1872626 RepID=UPI001D3CFBA1|nr:UbiA family prenyltransferase [Archaeoglobus sp.]MBO8179235.1 UbiA family prenyltransferase [Archaeoglobus sp.]